MTTQLSVLLPSMRSFVESSLAQGASASSHDDEISSTLADWVGKCLEPWCRTSQDIVYRAAESTKTPHWGRCANCGQCKGDELSCLVKSLLAYVPPAGLVSVGAHPDKPGVRTLRLAPTTVDMALLGALYVRYATDLWTEFVRPWEPGRDPKAEAKGDAALSKLVTKAVADIRVEGGLAYGS